MDTRNDENETNNNNNNNDNNDEFEEVQQNIHFNIPHVPRKTKTDRNKEKRRKVLQQRLLSRKRRKLLRSQKINVEKLMRRI